MKTATERALALVTMDRMTGDEGVPERVVAELRTAEAAVIEARRKALRRSSPNAGLRCRCRRLPSGPGRRRSTYETC